MIDKVASFYVYFILKRNSDVGVSLKKDMMR